MPAAGRGRATPAQIGGDQRAELDDPASDGLTADLDPALDHQLLDVADAEGLAELEANLALGGVYVSPHLDELDTISLHRFNLNGVRSTAEAYLADDARR